MLRRMSRTPRPSTRGPAPAALLAAAGALVLGLAVAACGDASSAQGDADRIAPEALAARLEAEAAPLVLDVRTPGEYASGHVPGAVNVPHTEIDAWLAERAPAPDTEVVVYCERGGRAARAEAALRDAGFARVRHLEGDMSAWRARDDLPCAGC